MMELRGQAWQKQWTALKPQQGLPAQRINKLILGQNGYYWLASEGAGLIRYDGADFQTLRNEEQPLVLNLAQDAEGNIWLADESRLSEYNGRSFSDFPFPQNVRYADFTLGPQNLYLLSRGGSVFKLEGQSWQDLQAPETGARHLHFAADTLWLGGDKGWWYWSHDQWVQRGSLPVLDLSGKDRIRVLLADRFLKARLGFQPESAAFLGDTLAYWNRDTLALRIKQVEKFTVLASDLGEDERILKVFVLPAGELAIAGREGIYFTAAGTAEIWPLEQSKITALLPQPQGLYFGTREGLFFLGAGRSNRVPGTTGLILCLNEFQGEIYAGTEKGLFVLRDGTLRPVTGFSDDFIFDMEVALDQLWLTSGRGIFVKDKEGWQPVSEQQSFPLATFFSIKKARADSSLWFATYTQGFFRYHRGSWQQLKRLGDLPLDSLRFSCFYPLNRESLWLGTLSNGLFFAGTETFSHYQLKDLNFAEIYDIAAGADDLLLATNRGFISVEEITTSRASAKGGNMPFWEDQLKLSALEYQNPYWYIATAGRLLRWPQEAKVKQTELKINRVRLFLEGLPDLAAYADSNQRFPDLPVDPVLPHDRNFLSFDFALSKFARPEKVFYRYRLSGQSEQWTYAANRRQAIYPDLNPGQYRFEVEARFLGGDWAYRTAFPFEIKRPFWSTWWFITFGLLALVLLTYLILRSRWQRIQKRLILEKNLADMERKALRLQMNPHFIFNALDSISAYIFRQEPKQAVRYLNNFAKLMRLTLESSMEHLHPVETEVSILKNYLELEMLRFRGKFEYRIELDEAIDYDVGIPPMLVQPHVENAILHGLKPREKGGLLSISFKRQGDLLCVMIEDNGIGREKARQLTTRKKHRSMATQINKDRLALLRKNYGDRVDLKIEDKYAENGTAQGTKVTIKLPAEEI